MNRSRWIPRVVLAFAGASLLCTACRIDSRPSAPGAPGTALDDQALADEDGYRLWLRYPRVWEPTRSAEYQAAFQELVAFDDTPTLRAAQAELQRGLGGLLGVSPTSAASVARDGSIVLATSGAPALAGVAGLEALRASGPEGFIVRPAQLGGFSVTLIAGNSDVGVLYGSFALLRQLQ